MKYKKTLSKNRRRNRPQKNRQQIDLFENGLHEQSRKHNAKTKVSEAAITQKESLSPKYVFIMLLITAIALIAIYHKSVLIYWQQTYHHDLFNSGSMTQKMDLDDSDGRVEEYLKDVVIDQNNVIRSIDDESHLNQPVKNVLVISPSEMVNIKKDKKRQKIHVQPISIKQENTKLSKTRFDGTPVTEQIDTEAKDEAPKIQNIPLIHEPLPIVLTQNDKVLFVGDSLMQGVAPYVKKMLFKQYKIESVNLSKQSTGLAYPKAFNWPKTINDNLIADPSIKLLVVFLGPNDPWDFPVKGYAKYVKFKSELWEEQYRLRIATILNSASEHNVQVLWLAAPCMRKPQLNLGMVYLNTLYQSEVEKRQQHFLTTNQLLGCTYETFNSFIESNKDKIKVRVDDGIHFTPIGQKILAKAIMDKIIFKQFEDDDSD